MNAVTILRFGPGTDDDVAGESDACQVIEMEKGVKRLIVSTLLIAIVSLVMIGISMTSHEWYVADTYGFSSMAHEDEPVPTHFGLLAAQYDFGDVGRAGAAYEDYRVDGSHEGVAYDLALIMIAVIATSFWFMVLVGGMEGGLEKGYSKWYFHLPPIVGVAALILLVVGLLYFVGNFEDALINTGGEGVDRSTADYGWPVWMAVTSAIVLLMAIAVSWWCAFRAVRVVRVKGEVAETLAQRSVVGTPWGREGE